MIEEASPSLPGLSYAPLTLCYTTIFLQVCHKLADLLPKRLGITPLLPPQTSLTSLALNFCHQDIRNQLRVRQHLDSDPHFYALPGLQSMQMPMHCSWNVTSNHDHSLPTLYPQAHIGYGLAKACSELQLALGCSGGGGGNGGGAVAAISDIVHQVLWLSLHPKVT